MRKRPHIVGVNSADVTFLNNLIINDQRGVHQVQSSKSLSSSLMVFFFYVSSGARLTFDVFET